MLLSPTGGRGDRRNGLVFPAERTSRNQLLNPGIVLGSENSDNPSRTRSNVGHLRGRHVTKDVAPESPLGRVCTRSIFLPLRPWVDGGPDISRTGGSGMESD